MKQTLAATVVTCAAFLAGVMPASAQAPSGAYLGGMRCNGVIVQHRGRLACSRGGAAYAPGAGHAYERWSNGGGPALSGSSAGNGFPGYFRGFGSVHDFGR